MNTTLTFWGKHVCEGVYVHIDCTKEKSSLHPFDYPHMLAGLKKVASKIVSNTKYECTVIVITKTEYNLCCMQNEGLVAGMMEWAAVAFGFECPVVDTDFDGEQNRYIFHFPDE